AADRLERPEGAFLLGEHRPPRGGERLRLGLGARGAGSLVDPGRDRRLLARREFLLPGRHLVAVDPLPEQALLVPTGDDRRARFAPVAQQPRQANVEAAFRLLLLAVALKAMRL